MKKAFLFLTFSFLVNVLFAQQHTFPIAKPRPADYEYLSAPDSTGKRTPLKMPSLKNTRGQTASLPYPIIFIHGLNSNSDTWNITTDFMDANYGTTYGGRFDFCLNYDGDNTIANTDFYPISGADLAYFTPTLTTGDYYYVNFDVGSDGSFYPDGSAYDVESNQSAVVKQGLALSWAIYYVLQETGRDKVILMGHSMGGLAAREYLQNPDLWQADGKSHVAKFVTTGTPHGGSNASFASSLGGYLPNEQSEAVRDLRTTYTYSGDNGVYLFGGYESNSVMYDMYLYDFYNVDVNCNGITGDDITGLDQKNLYLNLDYSCIIGECTTCLLGEELPGDGVVNDACANLNNYYTGLNANLFYYDAPATFEIHTDLPSQIQQNMQGLDEPDNYNLAYSVGFDTLYEGFTTVQATNNSNYPTDFDEYKFTLPINSNLAVNISNVSLPDLSVHLVDTTFSTISSTYTNNGTSTISFSQTLKAGTYFLEIFGTEPASNIVDPYTFELSYKNVSTGDISINSNYFNSFNYPNPFKNTTTIAFSLPQSNMITIKVYNLLGQIVSTLANEEMTSGEHKIDFDASALSSSIYYYRLQSGEYVDVKKIDLLR